jgi:hypothetical protein
MSATATPVRFAATDEDVEMKWAKDEDPVEGGPIDDLFGNDDDEDIKDDDEQDPERYSFLVLFLSNTRIACITSKSPSTPRKIVLASPVPPRRPGKVRRRGSVIPWNTPSPNVLLILARK